MTADEKTKALKLCLAEPSEGKKEAKMQTDEAAPTKKKIRIFDPALTFLACEAAYELDNYLTKQSRKFEKVTLMVERLENSIEFDTSAHQLRSRTDSASYAMMFRALSDSMGHQELRSNLDILLQAIKDSNFDTPTSTSKERIEKMRDFFLALSRRSGSIRTGDDSRKKHPYRR